ncbi:CoA-binding protein, partial [Vibrio sp. V05_P4A8T149]
MNNLNPFLKPKSIAVVGASVRSLRAGNIVMKNLLQGGFDGAIMPVTPYYPSVCGVLAYKSIESLPIVPDIAILCTHATRNVTLFKQLADKCISSVIVLSSDMYTEDAQGVEIQAQCSSIAKSAG